MTFYYFTIIIKNNFIKKYPAKNLYFFLNFNDPEVHLSQLLTTTSFMQGV